MAKAARIIAAAALLSVFVAAFAPCQDEAPLQRVTRPVNLWPLYYHSSSDEEERLIVFSLYDYIPPQIYSHHKSKIEGTEDWHILGFYHRMLEGDEKRIWLYAGFYYHDEPGYTSTIAGPVVPLVWYFDNRDKEKKTLIVFPVCVSKTTNGNTLTIGGPVLPLVWYRHSEERGKKSLLVIPEYYSVETQVRKTSVVLVPPIVHTKTKDSEFTMVSLLFWQFTYPESRVTVIPPYYKIRQPDKTRWGIFPLMQSGYGEGYYSWSAILFLFSGSGDDKTKTYNVSLLGPLGYMRNESPDSLTEAFLFPLAYLHYKTPNTANPTREIRFFTALCGYFRDTEGSLAYFTLFYKKESAGWTKWGFFPLAWLGYGKDRLTLGFIPLAWGDFDDKAQTESLYILPPIIYMHSKDRFSTFTMALFPVGYMHRHDGDADTYMITPLGWHYRDRHKSMTLALPLYYHDNTDGNVLSMFTPLFWSSSSKNSSSFVGLPLLWWLHDGDGQTDSNVILPIYYYTRDRDSWFREVCLMYWSWGDSGYLFRDFLALCWQQKTAQRNRYGIFPFLWVTDGGTYGSSVVFPFWWHSEDLAGESSSTTFVPFYHHSTTAESSLTLAGIVVPFFASYTTQDYNLWAVPFFWRFTSEKDHASNFGILPPFFWYGRSDRYRFNAFMPVYYYFRNIAQDEETLFVAPVYYHRYTPDFDVRVALPLLHFHVRDTFHSLNIWALFYYRDRHEDYLTQGVFPVVRWKLAKNYWWFYAFPLNWGERDYDAGTTSLMFLPFYYLNSTRTERFEMVTPLYWDSRQPGNITRFWLLPPIFYNAEKTERYGTMTRVSLVPFLWYAHGRGYSLAAFYPFFGAYSDSVTDSGGSFLLPLWAHLDSSESRFSMWTPFWWDYENKTVPSDFTLIIPPVFDNRGRLSMLIPLCRYATPEKNVHTLFPFWWLIRKEKYVSYVSVFPPVWGYSDRNAGTASLTIFPVFYRHKGFDDSLVLVFPAYYRHEMQGNLSQYIFPFYYRHRGADYRSVFLVPFYYDKEEAGDRFQWAFPTYFRNAGPVSSSWMLFPLAWGGTDSSRGTSSWNVLPFLYYWRSPEEKIRAFLPFHWYSSAPDYSLGIYGPYYTWNSADGYHRKGIFPLAWTAGDPSGYYSAGLIPLFLMTRDEEKHRFSSTLLPVFHYSQGPERGFGYGVVPLVKNVELRSGTGKINVPLFLWGFAWYNSENRMFREHILLGPVPLIQYSRVEGELKITSVLWYLYRREENLRRHKVTVEIPLLYSSERINGELTYRAWFVRMFVYDRINREKVYFFFIKSKLD